MKIDEEDCFEFSHKLENEVDEDEFEASITQIINSLEDESSNDLNSVVKPQLGLCFHVVEIEQKRESSSIRSFKDEIIEEFIAEIKSKEKRKPLHSFWSEIDTSFLEPFSRQCSVKVTKLPEELNQMYQTIPLEDLKRLSLKRKNSEKPKIPEKRSKLYNFSEKSKKSEKSRKSSNSKVEKTSKSRKEKSSAKSTSGKTLIKLTKSQERLEQTKSKEKPRKVSVREIKDQNGSGKPKHSRKSTEKLFEVKQKKIVCETFIPALTSKKGSKRNEIESSLPRGYLIMNDTSIRPSESILSKPNKAKNAKKRVSFCNSIFIRRFEPDDDLEYG